jgi:SH3-like domain-containing protein
MAPCSKLVAVFAFCGLVSLSVPVAALAETGLPLPRYASLRANKVHLRTGPGIRYPVDWIFVSRGMPVEITAEFENWRRVRDWQGTEGWVHRSMLSGKRTAVVTGGIQPMRQNPDPESALAARVMEKVVGRVLECEGAWCRIEIGKRRGWMQRAHIWGVYSDEQLK